MNGVCPLDHLGVIRAQGEEAAKFLHGQLTQDMVLLPDGQARLAAYCSPKGRVLASFVVVKRSANDIVLVCHRSLLAATLKRLAMFVMRAKVQLSDATADFNIFGLAGSAQIQPTGLPWSSCSLDTGASVVQLYPCGKTGRQLLVTLQGAAEPPSGPTLEDRIWAWSEIMGGVATVEAATSELFVPQMINFESVGGVNFKKGCYPGQEVVARSQFRGTLKRRTFLATTDQALLRAGQEIFAGDDMEQPVGIVVQSAAQPLLETGCVALLCLQTAADMANLRVQDVPSCDIRVLELPYSLLEDV